MLAHRATGRVLLLVFAMAYVAGYFAHPLYPGHDVTDLNRGWWTWTDQSRYRQQAEAMAALDLNAQNYFYPIGYPLLGAAFIKWMPVNPFLIPNLLLMVGSAMAWWRLAQRWLTRRMALLVAAIFILTHRWLVAQTMVVPWNTIATQCALTAGLCIVLETTGKKALRWLAILAALTSLVRPIDAVAFVPLLALAISQVSGWRDRIRSGVVAAVVVAAPVLVVGCLNLRVLGQWQTVYEIISVRVIGFFSYPVSLKFFWLFVDGGPLFGESEPALLFRYPWLFLVLPAAIFVLRRERARGAALLAAVAVNVILYVNYNDLLPSDLFRFTLIHYIAWTFPILFLLAAAACRYIADSRWTQFGFGASAVLFIFCVGLQLEPRGLAVNPAPDGGVILPATRPLLVHVSGLPMESVSGLRLEGRALVEYSEYVAPYLPSDLRILLGTRTGGSLLTMKDTGFPMRPEASKYVWSWRLSAERFRLPRAF
jgi:hypothetical protein